MVDAEGQAKVIEQDINERMARFAPSQAGPDVDPIAAEIAARASIPSAQPTMQEASVIDPVAMQIATRNRESMNAAVLGARSVNPDEATRAEQLGQRIGIGPEIARADMARAEQQAYLMDLRAKDYPRTDPILANYLENRQFAETAHDDLGVLEMVKPLLLEAAMIQARGAPALFDAVSRGYQRGKKQMELGEMKAMGMVRFPTPQEREDIANLTKEIQDLGRGGAVGIGAEMIGQYAANLKEIGAFSAGGAAIGSVIPGVGTAIGGGLGLAAGILKTGGTPVAGNLYNTLNEKGVSDDIAIPAAIAGGFLGGLVEVVGGKIAAMPVQALAKRVMAETLSEALTRPTLQQAAKEFVKAYGLQVGGETFEEGTQAISEMLSEEIALAASGIDSELTMREGFMRVIESALYGAAGSAILGGVGPGANLLIDLRRASNTERQTKVFEDLAANRKESKYANRNPVGYERFLASQAEGTTAETIYVDGRIAQQVLAQSGVPTAQLEEILPGIRERISEAVQTGGDVTIPTARFGARLANTDLGNALLPHMRLSPDAMSATEAQEFATRRQEVVREAEQILAQKQETDAAFVAEAREIEDTMAGQIVATGQMDEKAARTSAQFMRDFYVTQAAALGITPRQVYERFPVRVEGAMPAAVALEQATTVDISGVATPQYRRAWHKATTGKPITVTTWHSPGGATAAQLTDFAREQMRRDTTLGGGWYGARDRDIAKIYGTPEQFEVTLQNPFVFSEADKNFVLKLTNEELQRIRDAGYDGIIVKGVNATLQGQDRSHLQVVAFNPEQAVRRSSPNIMEQAAVLEQAPVTPGFYSALEREVGAIDAKALTASGWGERFKGLISKGAIKADELEWSGLADYLKMQEGKVSKDAVLEFLRGNGVRVERVTMGGPPANIDELRNALARAEMAHDEALERETAADRGDDEAAAIAATEAANQTRRAVVQAKMALDDAERATETKYEQYTLPGGRNYREVLLTLPISAPARTAQQDRYNRLVAAGVPLLQAQEMAMETGDELQTRIFALQKEAEPLSAKVEGLANVIASHTEFSSGTIRNWLLNHPVKEQWQPQIEMWMIGMGDDAKQWIANRGYLESLAQWQNINLQIRELRTAKRMREFEARGYESGHWSQRNVLVHLRMNDRVDADGKRVLFVEEVQSDWGQSGVKYGFANQRAADEAELAELLTQQEATPTEARRKQIARVQGRLTRGQYQIARAPYVETTDGWLNLGLKQVLLEAVRGNYDRVAFVNGEQSADRYSLSKQVESLSWTGYDSRGATKLVSIYPKQGNPIELPLTDSGVVVSTGNQFDGKALDEIVPKEIADQIMGSRNGELTGEQLEVGGEGMTEFYDKIVPIAMNKLLKKYGGGKVGPVEIATGNKWSKLSIRSDGTNYWVESRDGTRMSANANSALKAMEFREKLERGIGDQPGFTVTPDMVKKLESGLPLFQAAAGPARGGFDPRRLTTILTKTADLSTFLHESAHAFLTFYEQVSQAPDAPARIVNDMDELLRWFKIDGATPAERLAKWNGLTLDQKRQYHETFAYNFEVYLFEGKAPSAEMQGMFERFSAWLKRVYRSIRDDLNAIYRREFGEDLPILTGEVRQVMDRMLATDEQIKRQAAINEMKPQFQTQEQSGMDDAEWAAYQAMQQEAIEASVTDMNKASMRQLQWLGNARSRILRDMQKKHDAKRKEVASEVAAELRVEPVYRAMTYLRTGKFIDSDGAEVTVEGPHRLDTKRTQAIYAGLPTEKAMEAVRATGMAMPKVFAPDIAKLGTGKYGMLGVDGLDPDVVAETFGFGSGDQMIRALLAAKPIKEAVAERTDAEMLRRYGDMNTPEAQEAEVQKALHNEARARFVAVELRHVARATEPVRVMLEAAKQVARELIAGMTLREVRPADFIAAEARAARDAGRMGATVNPEAVGQAAQTRAYNEAIEAGTDPAEAMAAAIEKGAEAARKAQERSDALKAQYGADPQQALIRAKRAQLYQNQLAAEALRVREEVAKQVKYLRRILRDTNVKAMGAQAADQVAALLERFEVAPVSLKRLDERKALAAWLAEQEAAGLVPDIAPEVANEARRVNYQQLTVAEFRDLVDAIRQIEFIGKNERKVQLAAERAAYEEKRDEIVTRIRAVGRLRGVKFDPRSPLTNIGRSAAALRGFAAQHLKAASVARILDGGEDDGPLWTFAIRSANAAADMETRMRAEASAKLAEILAPVFALGNMGGKGVLFPSINLSLNREARLAIAMNVGNDGNRQRLLDGEGWTMEQIQPILESLTEAEWNAVQQVWDYIDTYRPLIAEKERRLYGKEPQWVTPVPMSVRTADGKTVNLTGGYYPIKYDPVASKRVATLDEVEEAKRALNGAYTAATTQRSFTKARAAKPDVGPLLYTLDAAFGGINDVIHDLSWHEWLIQTQRLLRDPEFKTAVTETRGPEFLKQLKDWANDNAAGERKIGVAGEAALSWLRQGISASGLGFNVVSAAMQVTGFNQSIVRLGAKYVGRGVAQFAASPIDTARMVADKSSFMAERGRTQFREINEIRNRVRGQTEVARRVTAGTYFLMMNMQRTVDIPTWLAGYQKALDAGKDDATAVALADQAVRDTQGSGLISDLSAIERGGPVMKLFTVFYSYMNTVYNMTAVQTMTARSKGKLAADYAMLLVVPVVLGQAIKNLIQPDAGDDELDPEALARKLAAEELSFLMGTMVIAREFGGAAQLLTGAEGVRMGYGGPAGLRAVGEVYGLATQAGQLEFDRAFRRSAINTLGAFTGLPSAQVNRTIDGIEAVIEGEVEGVGAVVAPITGVQR
jgi:hypothetical protein